eukprot:42178-Rhodomonas_salina.2
MRDDDDVRLMGVVGREAEAVTNADRERHRERERERERERDRDREIVDRGLAVGAERSDAPSLPLSLPPSVSTSSSPTQVPESVSC